MHHHHHHHHTGHGTPVVATSLPTPPSRRPEVVPRDRLPLLAPEAPTLARRAPDSSETCGSGSTECEKPTSTTSNTTLPVVLGAVVPIVCAIIVLFLLHRRNVKRLRREDANDKHKSLDFGLDLVNAKPGRGPMQQAEKGERNGHMKGVSLDIAHPYLLPPGLHKSRESLHSGSRPVGEDDKYRQANPFMHGDGSSVRSHPRGPHEDTASLAGSSRYALGDDMNQGLLGNAQRMSRSSPPLSNTPPSERNTQSPINNPQNQYAGLQLDLPRSMSPGLVSGAGGHDGQYPAASRPSSDVTDFKKDHDQLDYEARHGTLSPEPLSYPGHDNPSNFPLPEPALSHPESHPEPTYTSTMPPPRISLPLSDIQSDYGDERKSDVMIPAVNVHGVEDAHHQYEASGNLATIPIPEEPSVEQNQSLDTRRDTRRMTLGLRPLPPEDPSDNPEQRANRIRSFYKEYFDDSKPAAARETYYEDYGDDFYPEYYDPYTGEYYPPDVPAPYAEPVSRRAMTPPPRAPPRFHGPAMHMATNSASGLSGFSSPRAMSSVSGRFQGARAAPRKPMPPPAPLNVLPSPSMMKDDSFMNAIDFAPGKNFRDRRDGRPESPYGGVRPFSPSTRAHTPLASAFDELAVMPSPHALRKSGTFTALDFVPPPRFKNTEGGGSDSGSIRSVGTGLSSAHLYNIRHGAYRVSRLPTETVGTKDDLMTNLKPKWDMR